jgi:APA family basic amino acid/polyamine antiporter
MAGVVTIGETVANVLFGSLGGRFMVVAIIISVLGALNGAILTGPRVYYAMAQDGLFFKRAAEIHPRYRTPAKAIVYQAVWASILTLSGTFEQLITFVVVVNLILWIAGAAAVFALRKNRPELPKPYKTWGYPWTPALFIIFSIFFVLAALLDAPLEALAGIGLMLLGLPIYFYWNRSNNDS